MNSQKIRKLKPLPPLMYPTPTKTQAGGEHSKKDRKATKGRFADLNNFVDFTMGDLPRASIAVWLVLYRDTKDGIAATAQADIARRAGLSERSVRKAIRRLESLGLLKVVRLGSLNRGVSRYKIAPLTRSLLPEP